MDTDDIGGLADLRSDSRAKKDLEELRSFVENCVAYKWYKIYSINEEKASDKEKYYEAHDSQLDAFHDAVFALERRNIDLDSITYEGIKIRQPHIAESALLSLFNVDATGILLQKLFLSTWSSKIISLQIINLHFFHFQKPFFFLDAFCAYPDINTMYHGDDIFI